MKNWCCILLLGLWWPLTAQSPPDLEPQLFDPEVMQANGVVSVEAYKHEFFRDKPGKLPPTIVEIALTQAPEYVHFFDSSGQVILTEEFPLLDTNWVSERLFAYNDQGQLIREIRKPGRPRGQQPFMVFQTDYEYDFMGHCKLERSSLANEGPNAPEDSLVITWGFSDPKQATQFGNLVWKVEPKNGYQHWIFYGDDQEIISTLDVWKDKKGRLAKTVEVVPASGEYQQKQYAYTKEGRLKEVKEWKEEPQAGKDAPHQWKYSYDKQGQLIHEKYLLSGIGVAEMLFRYRTADE